MEHWGFKMEIDEIPVGKAEDLKGKVFGRLTVLYRVKPPTPQKQRGIVFWKCKCSCGNEKIIRASSLTGGHTKSCGCLKSERIIKYNHQCKNIKNNQLTLAPDEIPIGKAEDLRGQKFGRLTVLYRVEKPDSYGENIYGAFWKCRCDCGNEIIVYANSLKSGRIISCGCAHKEFMIELGKSSVIDLTGQKYGKLTVIKRIDNSISNRVSWLCKCDCGNETIVDSNALRSGNTKSCGCLNYIAKTDLTGQRFGILTVICQTPKPKGYKTKGSYWKCRCDCGNIIIRSAQYLQSGDALSCGCAKTSRGEEKIQQLLQNNKLKYIKEYRFNDCKSIKRYTLPFDFYIENSYLIEYDGIQHFEPTFTEESFKITQRNDKVKNEYCKSHNIPLIRIPYTHYDKITIDDLRPETSQFLIT